MEKNLDAFRTIGEVAEDLDLPQHVLRFWETKFIQIKPLKRAGGRRYYRPDDVQLVEAIRVLLYSEGYTIKGVQRILKEQGARAVVAASRANGRNLTAPYRGESSDHSQLAEPELGELLAPLRESALLDEPGLELWAEQEAAVPDGKEAETGEEAPTRLSPQDHHRLRAILAELNECARLLDEAMR
jgi:DNA-binding transcriptional MerR regulator